MNRKDAAVLRKINATKLNDIAAVVRRRNDWSAARTSLGVLWYRRYLWASYKHGVRPVFAIIQEADEIWHGHIVYTKRYRADCKRIFGRYLDHTPYHGRTTKQMKSAFDGAVTWFKKEYPDDFPEAKRAYKTEIPLIFTSVCY